MFLSYSINVKSQARLEIGFLAGGMYYLGELNKNYHFKNTKPAGGFMARYNFNPYHSIRTSALIGSIKGDDSNSENQYSITRNHNFSTSIVEIASTFEFNYLSFVLGKSKNKSTPYLSSGFTYSIVLSSIHKHQITIPICIGFKAEISNRWLWGAQLKFNKTFTDYLDNIAGFDYQNIKGLEQDYKQFAFFYDKDWYSTIEFFFNFRLSKVNSECPVFWEGL